MDLEKKLVLILGGSCFMGKDLLFKISMVPEFEVHYINRGKRHWNDEVKQIKNIHYTYGNRNNNKDFTKLLSYLSLKLGITKESGRKWEMVVDFCAYRRKNVRSVVNALSGLLNLYLFISTDSVYEVSDDNIRKTTKIIEEYSVRPEDYTLIKKLKKDDDYGHNKLKAEEYLNSLDHKEDFPYLCLRLADVIGPYDDSGRFWAYILWMKYYAEYPIEMEEEDVKHQMSFVYSVDVSEFILLILSKLVSNSLNPDVLCQSYNLAFEESINLPELLKMMADAMKTEIECKVLEDTNNTFYPSVTCGPLDISKACKNLEWKPSKLTEAVYRSVDFFLNAEFLYKTEFREALRKLPKYLTTSSKEETETDKNKNGNKNNSSSASRTSSST